MIDKNPDKIKMSIMAERIFTELYTFSNETITDAMVRVSSEFGDVEHQKIALNLLKENIWRPSTPIWFAAGQKKKIFSACWVVGLEDSMDGIYDIANVARKIFQSGAGIGIPIGNLREKDAHIYEGMKNETPSGKSSGPISFMTLYDAVGATTKSGGRARRAAIMCVMPVSHPDIIDFIQCKSVDGVLSNMNISVAITDDFMKAFKDNIPFNLVSPANGVVKEINARVLWDMIIDSAWKTADPGVLFIDTINKFNPLKKVAKIQCCNPCITGDSFILMYDGSVKRMDDIVDGDEILSFDIENNVIENDFVEKHYKTRENAEVIDLEIEDDGNITHIKCTPDHKIYTKNRGYVEAKNITESDDIFIKYMEEIDG